MTNQEFIQYIQTQASYQEVFNQYKPLLASFGGSRCMGYANEYSDYDLIFIVADPSVVYKNIKIVNDQELSVHVMIRSWEELKNTLTKAPINSTFYTLLGLAYVINDQILYISDDFKIRYQALQDNYMLICEEVLFNIVGDFYYDIVNIIKSSEYIYFPTKLYYHFIRIYDTIAQENHSDLIKRIRTHYKTPIEDDDLQLVKQILQHLIDFYNHYDITKTDYIAGIFEVL